jgi:hypothetical protein
MKDLIGWLEKRRHLMLAEKRFRKEQEELHRQESRADKYYLDSLDPEKRKLRSEYAKRYNKKRLESDPEFKEKNKAARKRHYEKIKDTPEFKEKNRIRTREYYYSTVKKRYQNDEEYRKHINRLCKISRDRRKEQKNSDYMRKGEQA